MMEVQSARRLSVQSVDDGEFVPGTVFLVDSGKILDDARHASGKHQDIVLVPTPSADPEDPLNWSRGRKLLSLSCMVVYTVMVAIASAAIYSVLVPIAEDTGLTLGDLNAGTGYMFLFFGWGCLVWQPLALQYGKRPVFLFSILATMAIMLWVPHTNTNGQWIASKILQGFFGAPIESLCEISITDVFFTHERGGYIAIYGLALAGSSFFAPVISGFIADSQGWAWVLYWCAIFCAIGFVYLFFFMEETNYHRAPMTKAAEDTTEKSSTTGNQVPSDQEKFNRVASHASSPVDGETYKRRSYLDKIKLFQPGAFSRPNMMKGMVLRPLIFLSFPVIFYAGFSYGSNLIWFNVLNGTAALILTSSPYNFKASIVGLSYLAPMIGVFVGAVYTGLFGDWFIVRMARRNKGVMEPEHRLWIFSLSLILIPAALLLWGVGAANHVHWFGLLFAMFLIAITNTIGVQVSISYCIDSYRALSGEAVVTVILVRNTMSFAVSYGITPWVTNLGLQNAFILAAFVGLAQVLTFFIFVKWGKSWRQASVQRYRRYLKEMEDAGLAH